MRKQFLALAACTVLLGTAFALLPKNGPDTPVDQTLFTTTSAAAPALVETPATTGDDAQFIAQNVPATMVAGAAYAVTVTVKNTGTTDWDKTGSPGDYLNAYRLKSQNPNDNTIWGTNFAPIPWKPIAAGATVTIPFTVIAPSSPGSYNFQWRMNKGGVGWFGLATPNITVQVTATEAAPTPPPARPGFVYVQGKQLMLDGQTWWSKGSNWLGSWTVNQYCPYATGIEAWCNMRYLEAEEWDPEALEKELRWLHEVTGINTLRLNAVGLDSDGNWKPGYEARILEFTRMAYRQNMRIAWTLFFGVPGFKCPQPDGSYAPCNVRGKADIGGAILMPPGSEDETRTLRWVRNFATLLKNEPGVLAYEVGNEMILNYTGRATGYQEQLLSYVSRILAEVRRVDPNHFFVSGEVAVLERLNDDRLPWLGGKGVDFVRFPDVHNLRGGKFFSLEDIVDVNGPHIYRPPEVMSGVVDVLVAAARKPILFGEFGGGGNAANSSQWPDPTSQFQWHQATINQARTRLAGAWVWNPVPFLDFKPGTYRVETWTDNAGGLRPLIILFGPPERRIRALSFWTYTFAPQDNPLNTLLMLPAAKEFANRRVTFVSQSVPTTMEAGRQYPVSITLRNAGDSPWDRGGNGPYMWRLKSQNPADNTTWGLNTVPMPSTPVRPGENATFSFTVTAPTSTGSYNFQWGLNQGAVGWFGDSTPNVSVTVVGANNPPPPTNPQIADFHATPGAITRGETTRLAWSSQYASSCSATGGWSGTKPLSGEETQRPDQTTTYVLTCRNGAGQSATAEVTVAVTIPPTNTGGPAPRIISFRADQTAITLGASITLTWQSADATSCSATGGWSGTKPTSGTERISPKGTADYTLICRNASGAQVSGQLRITVAGGTTQPPATPPPSQTSSSTGTGGTGGATYPTSSASQGSGSSGETDLWNLLGGAPSAPIEPATEASPRIKIGTPWLVGAGFGILLLLGVVILRAGR